MCISSFCSLSACFILEDVESAVTIGSVSVPLSFPISLSAALGNCMAAERTIQITCEAQAGHCVCHVLLREITYKCVVMSTR